ncbi:YitT family protein [Candidatus Saccharibacteria bacterium]|nr:MAG: YitT family protein [Candidatus Saccharibacteria bacterium]
MLGSIVTAVGLQFFLLPNHLLDGGVTGLSIITAKLTGLPLGLFLLILNIPFVMLGYRKFGKVFAVYSTIGITTLALLTFFHVDTGATDVPMLAAIFGGLIVGLGVGLVIRHGGIIDGADTIAVLVDKVTVFTVGEAIMVINGTIITLAGFVYGWEQAMYSLIAYFIAHKAIDVVVEGLNEDRCMWIVSMHVREIGGAINQMIREPVTYIKEAKPGDNNEPHGIMLAVITRFEEQRLKEAIRRIDKHAYVVITSAHEVVDRVSEGSLYRQAS